MKSSNLSKKQLTDHQPRINLFHFLHNLGKNLLVQVILDIFLGNLGNIREKLNAEEKNMKQPDAPKIFFNITFHLSRSNV